MHSSGKDLEEKFITVCSWSDTRGCVLLRMPRLHFLRCAGHSFLVREPLRVRALVRARVCTLVGDVEWDPLKKRNPCWNVCSRWSQSRNRKAILMVDYVVDCFGVFLVLFVSGSMRPFSKSTLSHPCNRLCPFQTSCACCS